MLWPAVSASDLIELVVEFNEENYKNCLKTNGYAGFVFFDIGSVLLDLDWDVSFQAYENLLPEGSKFNYSNTFKLLRENSVLQNWCTGQIGAFDYAQSFMHALKKTSKLQDDYHFSAFEIKKADSFVVGSLRPSVLELAKKLKDLNFGIGVLSNATTWHEVVIEKRLPVRDIFDVCIFSQDLGCEKPEQKIYEIAQSEAERFVQKRFNATLHFKDIYFIDDTPSNVKAARAMNWNASLVLLFNEHILEQISKNKLSEIQIIEASHKRDNLIFGQDAAKRVEKIFERIVTL
ncbi:HAD family hydrolase [Fluviispira multicolorata]|uniref:HAD hydrolase-like protein n=1 Tax=Fluviispira multicolorata TaxID=2654512 RepID=A0A833N3J8_9BACT|nr:HAD family hydrolase [Fluviispira multicolorata]KAB8029939.1 HAD hydrolase-like protein [Fluviispira multicolorata]